jgi:F420-dependent oxidoreductase-like protein
MRIALLIEGQEGVTWDDWLRIARLAERAGLDGLYRSDHYTSIFRSHASALDAWATLAGLAASTTKIRLGTLVSPVTFRHPSVVARTAVTVDHISRGRVDLGLGLGWYEREHAANGFHFGTTTERFALLAEQVEVIVRSWTAQAQFDHDGRMYSLRDQLSLPRPHQVPHPPLILGGAVKPRFAELAARYANEVNTLSLSPEELLARRERLDVACSAIGRDPRTLTLSVLVTCFLGETRLEADERASAYLQSGLHDLRFTEAVSAVRDGWMVGSVDEVAAQVGPLKALGVSRLIVRQLDHHDDAMIEIVGSQLARELQ